MPREPDKTPREQFAAQVTHLRDENRRLRGELRQMREEEARLREENAELKDEKERLEDDKERLEDEKERLEDEKERLEGELSALRAQLAAQPGTSRNSHQPPSKDPPGVHRPSKPSSGRQRGGQPGHPGACRPLLPPEQVDAVHELHPAACHHCEHPLQGDDPSPERHQVLDLPNVQPTVTEYRRHSLVCPQCGHTTRAPLPEGVPAGMFDARIVAMVAMATGVLHLSKRQVAGLLLDWFSIAASPASICAMEQLAAAATAPAVDEAKQAVQEQPVVYIDETSWREARGRVWLWIAAAHAVAVFRVASRRTQAVAQELLGKAFAGFAVTDRAPIYSWLGTDQHQVCWAHLLRDFQKMAENANPAVAAVGEELVRLGQELFHHWHRYKADAITRPTLIRHANRLRAEIHAQLECGRTCRHRPTASTCQALLDHEDMLWHFVHHPGVEPTNNTAERILRPAVLWRKNSFGTDSPRGSRFVERILTVYATLKLQSRNVLDYLTETLRRFMAGRGPPSLLPAPE